MIAALAGVFAVCVTLVGVTGAPESIVGAAAIVAGHGAMLATALAWTMSPRAAVEGGARLMGIRMIGAPLLLLAAAAAVASAHDAGAVAFLALPTWFWRAASRGELVRLGLGMPAPPFALCAGAMLGVALGGHLLVVGSMTSGYRPQGITGAVVAAVLYDVGVQVLVTEVFFRGALFNRAQRWWSFAGATALVTLGFVGRYLVDPRLPGTAESITGMVFYMTMLSVANCWLFWRFGSLVPCLVNALAFFTAYRFVAQW